MKVLFLDVDGVLNTDGVLELSWMLGNKSNALCPHRIRLVSQIVQETDAEIVVSSDWRLDEHKPALDILRAALCMWALPIHSLTPDLSTAGYRPARWQEIESWINCTDDDIDNFVILDDRYDAGMPKFENNFVRTTEEEGLTETLAAKAIEILNAET